MYSWSLLYTQILTQVTYFVHQQYLKLHQGYSFPITLYVPDCTQLSDTGVLILYSFMRVPLPAKSCNLHTYKRWYNGFLCAPQISNFIQGGQWMTVNTGIDPSFYLAVLTVLLVVRPPESPHGYTCSYTALLLFVLILY